MPPYKRVRPFLAFKLPLAFNGIIENKLNAYFSIFLNNWEIGDEIQIDCQKTAYFLIRQLY
jgi:hypothetical protein